MARSVSLAEFGKLPDTIGFAAGNYKIEYHDATHHGSDEWQSLISLSIQPTRLNLGSEDSERYFTVALALNDKIDKDHPKAAAALRDALALALARAGIMAPEMQPDLLDAVLQLNQQDGVVVIPDSNALCNGSVHWLLRVLTKPAVWLFPLVVSLTQVQNRDAALKSMLGDTSRPNQLPQAVRSRGMVNGSLGLIERNKGRSQVIELDPSLLRYQKTAGKTGTDPDQSDILEDRLIIEGIHSVLRSMRSRTSQCVVTSDVHMGRILSAEGIPTLFVPTIRMIDDPIPCVRYDPLTKSFMGAPWRAVLWELAHTFGSVRLMKDGKAVLRLDCYWPHKSPSDWRGERLIVQFATDAKPGSGDRQSREAKKPKASTVTAKAKKEGVTPKREPTPKIAAAKVAATPAVTKLPRASLTQALNLLDVVRRTEPKDFGKLVESVDGDRPTADTARRAMDLLSRIGLVQIDAQRISPTAEVEAVDAALERGDLDALDSTFSRLEPYSVLREALVLRGSISRSSIREVIEAQLGSVGADEAERLPRYLVLLGQAWTDRDRYIDGSRRPLDRELLTVFDHAFQAVQKDGFAQVRDLLPEFCQLTKMSPWAAKKRLEALVKAGKLGKYRLEPAAGGKPVGKDEVLVGSLGSVSTELVALDRFQVGEQPVFTVGGAAK